LTITRIRAEYTNIFVSVLLEYIIFLYYNLQFLCNSARPFFCYFMLIVIHIHVKISWYNPFQGEISLHICFVTNLSRVLTNACTAQHTKTTPFPHYMFSAMWKKLINFILLFQVPTIWATQYLQCVESLWAKIFIKYGSRETVSLNN
jgi:hypothetical protein